MLMNLGPLTFLQLIFVFRTRHNVTSSPSCPNLSGVCGPAANRSTRIFPRPSSFTGTSCGTARSIATGEEAKDYLACGGAALLSRTQ